MDESPDKPLINRTRLPYRTDRGTGPRARIGAIVLATDHTMEEEWRAMLALPGVAFYVARIWNDAQITPETLQALGRDIAPATRLILPNDERLDSVAFACTSGAMVLGDDFVEREVRKHRPAIPVTSPMLAGITALRALGLKRVALLTPYMERINAMMRAHLGARGIEVPAMGSYNEPDDMIAATITPETLLESAIELARHSQVDGIFVSCSSFRAAGIIERLEAATGKPATSSNHAMAWHALRLAGYRDPVAGWGRLFTI
jgi:maleate isomerase